MERRRLGASDLEFSVIGLGTWAIGGGEWAHGWGPQDDKDSIATILAALECGINWIDTAPAYGLGKCEEVVGEALAQARASGMAMPLLATKCGLIAKGKGVVPNLTRASVLREAEDSLRRLRVETIDLYQIHWPNPENTIEEGFAALQELKRSGKIRYAGLSNFSVEQMQRLSKLGEITSLQPPYSALRRDIEAEVLPYCASHDIGVVAYSPMQTGILTGKLSREWIANLPQNDWRKYKKDSFFTEPKLSKTLGFIDDLKSSPLGKSHALAEIAINWVLANSTITSAIVGARRPDQIVANVKAASWQMSSDEKVFVDNLYHQYFG